MAQRGHALSLLLITMAVLLALGAMVSNHFAAEAAGRRDDDRRTQLIWLARSVAAAAQPGERQVDAAGLCAHVRVRSRVTPDGRVVEAEASMAGFGTARATASLGPDGRPRAWQEQLDRISR